MIISTETSILTKGPTNYWCWHSSNLQERQSNITLYHGTKSCKLELAKVRRINRSTILLPREISKALLLPQYCSRYQIRLLNSKNYSLGPLVGIFVSEKLIKRLLAGNFNNIYRQFANLLQRNRGLAVFFSLNRISWDKREVLGVVRSTTDNKEVWLEERLPIPGVIYDRCLGADSRSKRKTLRRKCASIANIRVINALAKLEKLQIYKLCSQISRFREHLPRWAILRHNNIGSILKQFPIAYVKPNGLSKGKGVTKISHTPSGYLVEQRRGPENFRHVCLSTSEVLKDLEPYISQYRFMVAQEAIPLMSFNGHPFDFRFLLQKDQSGNWKKAGLACRISGKGSVISSPRSGGSVATFDTAMAQLAKGERLAIAASMTNLALELAEAIDGLIGPYVELGFDFGVDTAGKVWIIEINGIPLKVSIRRLKNRRITRNVHENPILYAIYLAGFGRTGI